jgi:hypothetical protein
VAANFKKPRTGHPPPTHAQIFFAESNKSAANAVSAQKQGLRSDFDLLISFPETGLFGQKSDF